MADALRTGRLSSRAAAKALTLALDDFDELLREWGHEDAIEF